MAQPLVVIPIMLFISLPLTVLYQWFFNLGTQVGLWPAVSKVTVKTLGVMASLGLATAVFQWFVLRGHLARSGKWFAATAIGIWLGSIAGVLLDLEGLIVTGRTPDWSHPVELLTVGLILGLTQWLLLRDQIEKAFWLVPIDLIAVLSFLPIQWAYFYTFLLVFLPGMITGIGLWFLLRYTAAKNPSIVQSIPLDRLSSSTKIQIGVGLTAILFGGFWLNARLMLDDVKAQGVYPTFEEAVTESARRGFEERGFKILRVQVDDYHGTPDIVDGKRQHLRWGCAVVYQEGISVGHLGPSFPTCAEYVHTRNGWARIDEDYGSFVGWVMELYNLEGLREFQAGDSG